MLAFQQNTCHQCWKASSSLSSCIDGVWLVVFSGACHQGFSPFTLLCPPSVSNGFDQQVSESGC